MRGKRQVAILAAAVVLGACAGAGPRPEGASPPAGSVPQAKGPRPRASGPFRPQPGRHIPGRPRVAARELAKVGAALELSIRDWRRDGDPSVGKPPSLVTLQSLYEQRIYRKFARNPSWGRKVLTHLEDPLAKVARLHLKASVKLRKLVTPIEDPDAVRTGRAAPAGKLLRFYKAAEKRFNVGWQVLAAVNQVETKFNKVRSSSSAGAQGPMQFLPDTWDAYGMGGDIHDPHDAILGAANYLHASGAPKDYRKALYAYNHSDLYVDAILIYARLIRMESRRYFHLYSQQVYVITTKGDRRLTGPGKHD